jgi:hypothetical protein
VADQIKEADAARRPAQFAQERGALRAARVKATEVEGRKDFRLTDYGHQSSNRV